MSAITNNTFDERIIATYASADKAEQAKIVLRRKLGLQDKSIEIISPNDNKTGEKLEGKSKAVGSNMLRLHLKYASIGLIVGLVAAFLLVSFGPTLTQSSPVFTYIALISPGIFIGTFYAGLRSLKPEHDQVNQQAVKAKQEDYWTLLIDTHDTSVSKEALCEEIKETSCVEIKDK